MVFFLFGKTEGISGSVLPFLCGLWIIYILAKSELYQKRSVDRLPPSRKFSYVSKYYMNTKYGFLICTLKSHNSSVIPSARAINHRSREFSTSRCYWKTLSCSCTNHVTKDVPFPS